MRHIAATDTELRGAAQTLVAEADEFATIRISSLAELPEWVAALNHPDH